jgi:tRNA A37 threonylcarbamoyladenosine synthetase subunit TsaC/SUA5/YrdC
MKTIIMRMTHSKPEIKSIEYAARCIKEGKLVVFPTETVYGIGTGQRGVHRDLQCQGQEAG